MADYSIINERSLSDLAIKVKSIVQALEVKP
jgi:hypothetical protein